MKFSSSPYGLFKAGKGVALDKKKHVMKDYIHFFILFTLLEVLVTAIYFLFVKTLNLTVFIGAFLYVAGMLTAYVGYRAALYQKKKKEMLELLP